MTRTYRRSVVTTAALLVLVLGVATAGWTYFRGTGSGTGAAATGTAQPLTMGAATPVTQVYPGGQGAVAVTVTNPNPGPVRLESVAVDPDQASGGFAVDKAHAGCSLKSLSFTLQNNGGAGWDVPGNGSITLSLANALNMSISAADACQGASFTVYLKAGQ